MLSLLENEQGESLISMLCFRQEAGGYPDRCDCRRGQAASSVLLNSAESAVRFGSWGRRVDWTLCVSRGRDDEAFQTLDPEQPISTSLCSLHQLAEGLHPWFQTNMEVMGAARIVCSSGHCIHFQKTIAQDTRF